MRVEAFSYQSGRWSREFPAVDSDSTLVLAFSAPNVDDSALAELVRAFPRSHLLGCSTAGEILGTRVHDDSISAVAVPFERTRLRTALVPISALESFEAGRAIAEALRGPDLAGVLILSDGTNVNGSQLARGVSSSLPRGVVVAGGLAGDGDRFKRTWILARGERSTEMAVAVGLYGPNVRVGHGSKGGWDPFGPERRVTRSKANVLFELDGRPALQLYRDYLGELSAGLPATALLFPLAIRSTNTIDERVVRTVLDVDPVDQSMTFAGDVPEGAFAQLMRANRDRLVQGASDAASMSHGPGLGSAPLLSIAISCVGRRLVLRQRTEEETEAVMDNLPPGSQQVGFYAYGEISPLVGTVCELHNQTMTLMTVTEL